MEILKRQRDAVGLSVYSDSYEYYAPEKGSERHRKMILHQLEQVLVSDSKKTTETYQYLHEIAEKIHRRSLIFLFTDMFQPSKDKEVLFDALRHLKYNKHEVVLFHTFDGKTEFNFNFDASPKKFVDLETGEEINIYAENVKEKYKEIVSNYFKDLKNKCLQYKIDYVPVDINLGFRDVLTTYLISRRKFL
jgi:predicted DNA-binding antitoxin AbrB/MazE fold protein